MELNIFEHEPHKSEYYFDTEGRRVILENLVRLEPAWAANVIRSLKEKLQRGNLYNQQNSFKARSKIKSDHVPLVVQDRETDLLKLTKEGQEYCDKINQLFELKRRK